MSNETYKVVDIPYDKMEGCESCIAFAQVDLWYSSYNTQPHCQVAQTGESGTKVIVAFPNAATASMSVALLVIGF